MFYMVGKQGGRLPVMKRCESNPFQGDEKGSNIMDLVYILSSILIRHVIPIA